MKIKIKIKKISDGLFCIEKDDNFEFLIRITYTLYLKYIRAMKQEFKKEIYNNKELTIVLDKMSREDEFTILNDRELTIIVTWVIGMCQIILEADGIDFSNKQLLMYFRLAQNFVKKAQESIFYLQP